MAEIDVSAYMRHFFYYQAARRQPGGHREMPGASPASGNLLSFDNVTCGSCVGYFTML